MSSASCLLTIFRLIYRYPMFDKVISKREICSKSIDNYFEAHDIIVWAPFEKEGQESRHPPI